MLSSLPYPDDKELCIGIAAGNERYFSILFSRYYNKVYAFSFKVTHSAYQAGEMAQEVFLKLWMNRAQLKKIDNPEAWIFTITRNLCFNRLKKMAREKYASILPAHFEESLSIPAFNRVEEKELQEKLQETAGKLSPQQQLVYHLSREKGLRKKEIAEALHISENTVKTHLSIAVKKIRSAIETYGAAGLLCVSFIKKMF